MISIAIDGPSGAGKSTLAKALSRILGYAYLDTGAIYRTLGLFVKRNGIHYDDNNGIISVLEKADIRIKHENEVQHMYLGNEDVTGLIRTDEISTYASKVSALPQVRGYLMDMQRDFAKDNNVIMDGRDIGTVILPNATVKFFMSASDDERARRRARDLSQKGEIYTVDEIKKKLATRDTADSTRKTAPTVPASDAHMLDNTGALEDTINEALEIIRKTINEHN